MQASLLQAVINRFAYRWQMIWDKVYSPSQGELSELSEMSELELRDLGIGRSEIPGFRERQYQRRNQAETGLLRHSAPLIISDYPATNK
ncbi:DUF1127 domain-containing protein [Undibacterium jejuense]|uniref:DUF1127 domain-containing protein n=1 Tax=Undibacterium jejuense TaxID=1344949 RepID=A0A923KP67_9BURK|nr:DUF1127 domain-containing protein [Undibacterium jejuense]MBC3862558.1 DUF1127 domain-containing protein [Undibacterium jejuense]